MQADSIKELFVLGGFFLCFVFFSVAAFVWAEVDEVPKKMFSFVFAGVGFLVVGSLIPSSKTLAAMIVLPAITSEEVVSIIKPEAKELYELTKDALRSMATEKSIEETEK